MLSTGPQRKIASGNGLDLGFFFFFFPPLLGNSQSIQESDLTLGGCATSHSDQHVLQFQTELHDCGSKIKVFISLFLTVTRMIMWHHWLYVCSLQVTNDALIYSFNLSYVPTPIGTTFIVKTNTAEVLIECHYQRWENRGYLGICIFTDINCQLWTCRSLSWGSEQKTFTWNAWHQIQIWNLWPKTWPESWLGQSTMA